MRRIFLFDLIVIRAFMLNRLGQGFFTFYNIRLNCYCLKNVQIQIQNEAKRRKICWAVNVLDDAQLQHYAHPELYTEVRY